MAGWTAGTWTIDPAHTVVAFAARHLMSRVRGTFSQVNGKIVTSQDPALCSATAAVALSSVSTGNEMRDNHLRSADFFDTEHWPTMTFASTGLRQENGAWVLTGDLTIRAVTRPVEFEVEFLGVDPTGLQRGEPDRFLGPWRHHAPRLRHHVRPGRGFQDRRR